MANLLKNIASVRMGYSFRSRLEQTPNGNATVIQMKDLSDDNRLDSRNLALTEIPELKEYHQVRLHDLIFRSRGMTNTAALVDQKIACAVVAAPLLRIRVSGPSILPEYLCWFINLPTSQAFLQSRATGTAMRMIGKQVLDALEVQIPSLKTQRRIIELNRLTGQEWHLRISLAKKRKHLMEHVLMRAASDAQSRCPPPNRGVVN